MFVRLRHGVAQSDSARDAIAMLLVPSCPWRQNTGRPEMYCKRVLGVDLSFHTQGPRGSKIKVCLRFSFTNLGLEIMHAYDSVEPNEQSITV